jgi:hypothetical protein
LDAYRKKKAAKKDSTARFVELEGAKEGVDVGEKKERVDAEVGASDNEGEENERNDTNEEEEEEEEDLSSFAFTEAPEAVRYTQQRRQREVEETYNFDSTPPPPKTTTIDDDDDDGDRFYDESTPPVKMRSFETNEDDEDFDPEDYVHRFVTPEKTTTTTTTTFTTKREEDEPWRREKAKIDVPMDELEAIFGRKKNGSKNDAYNDNYIPFLPTLLSTTTTMRDSSLLLNSGVGEQKLSSFEREILESKRRREQNSANATISDMFSKNNIGQSSKLEQDEIISLQNMIDDLTTEKLSLKRGMDKNQQIIENLMEENESLTSAFNDARNRNVALEKQFQELSNEMMLHSTVHESISNDRDASRRGYIETRERANSLAREVVELEEIVLEYKSKLFLYENTQTDALERSKQLERALLVANEDRDYYRNVAEAMKEERREMQRLFSQSSAIQALIESGDAPIVEMLHKWLQQVQAKPITSAAVLPSSEEDEVLETSTSEMDENKSSEAVATTKELIEALTKLANNNNRNSNRNIDASQEEEDDGNEDEEMPLVDTAQIQLITSIHELLIQMEEETFVFRGKLKEAERRENGLRAANAALESQLERSTERTSNAQQSEEVFAAMQRINAGSAASTPKPASKKGFRFRTGLVPDDD